MEKTRRDLEERFRTRLARPVELTLTDNSRSLLSFRPGRGGGVILRLHQLFRDAPEEVLEAVAGWIESPRRRPPEVSAFVKASRDLIRPPRPRRVALRPRGRCHDLDALFARLNARYFRSHLEMRITWGRQPRRGAVRTVRLGTYCQESGVITISPRLDRADVPAYFVEYVVYHEMLHAALGIAPGDGGRLRIHPPAFRILEEQFHDYERARAWEKKRFGGGAG